MKALSIWIRIGAATLCALLCAGCTFDSSLGEVTCDREGDRDGDRICRDGFWVPADQADADATDTVTDAEPDVEPDIVADTDDADDAEDIEDTSDASDVEDTGDTGDTSDVLDADEDADAAECSGGETRPCFPFNTGTAGTGTCIAGEQQCEGGTFGACEGAVGPEDEICDGDDNDCDGTADNGFPDKGSECTVGAGACERTGMLVCNGSGDGLECDATPGQSSDEVCGNQVDEDCDGNLDNDCPQNESTCADGNDNDLDGLVDCQDPDCKDEVCGTGSGATCSVEQAECVENTCDGVDNDDDGDLDEGCDDDQDGYCDSSFTVTTDDACVESTPGDTTTYDCDDADGAINPGATEQCDGVDSDCDGLDDENDDSATAVCQANGPGGSDCRLKQGAYCCDPSPAGGC